MTRPLGVIFDMDGVLIDSYMPHYESWKLSAERRGLEMTEAMFASTFGQTNRAAIPFLYGDKFSLAEIDAWGDEKEELYRELIAEDVHAMDGVSELLDSLAAAGFALAIGSSGPRPNIQVVVDKLPGAHHFSAAITGSDITHSKPDPEIFLKAAEKLGLSPGDCLVVEDSIPGLLAAKNAGMKAIAITGTAGVDQLTVNSARVVESLREITPELVATLISA
ncbi:MAG: HAD family phosphatase [Planctomycetes bacterium]|nr:HAD family phosphatase [Planctomycetota bacterium]